MKSLNEEISRIKSVMLYETFGGSQNMIPKYVDSVIRKTELEKIFKRFLDGDKDLQQFRNTLITKIKSGDYGNDYKDVTKRLQYLKYIGVILAGLEEVFENDQKGNIEKELGVNFTGLSKSALLGEWCSDCKTKEDVRNFLFKRLGEIKKLEKVGKEDFEKFIKRMYGDPFGPLSFFRAHGTRIDDIGKKWGVSRPSGQGDDITMGDYKVIIEFLEDTKIEAKNEIFVEKNKGEKLPTEYDKKEKFLIHKTKIGDLIYFELDSIPKMGSEYTSKIDRILPKRGSVLVRASGSIKPEQVKFKIVKM